jgi:hypothetical protein
MQYYSLLSSLSSTAVTVMMRVAVMVVVSAVVPIAATLASTVSAVAVVCCYAPETVATPSAFLAFFRAVFGAAAAAALCELPWELFPFAALPVCALSDATARVILSAEIAHYYTSPV